MTAEQQARAAWYEAHDGLREFVQPFFSLDVGRRLASEACGLWVRNALDGKVPDTCAYALTFDAVSHLVIQQPGPTSLVSPGALSMRYPLSQSLLPYQLAKLYWDIWKAGQLLKWDQKIRNRASKGVSEAWPSGPVYWTSLDPLGIGPLAGPLGRRAVEVLAEHECTDNSLCNEAAEKWEAEDKRTETWFTARRLERLE